MIVLIGVALVVGSVRVPSDLVLPIPSLVLAAVTYHIYPVRLGVDVLI